MFVHNMFILYAFQGFFFLLHFLQSLTTFWWREQQRQKPCQPFQHRLASNPPQRATHGRWRRMKRRIRCLRYERECESDAVRYERILFCFCCLVVLRRHTFFVCLCVNGGCKCREVWCKTARGVVCLLVVLKSYCSFFCCSVHFSLFFFFFLLFFSFFSFFLFFFSLSFLRVGCDDLDICSCHYISLSSITKRKKRKCWGGGGGGGGGRGGGSKTCHFNILDFIYAEFCCVTVLFPSQKYCSWKNHAGYGISVFILSINDFKAELLTETKVSGELRSSWFHSTYFLLQYLKETRERYLSFCCGLAHRVLFVLFSYLFSWYFMPVECLFIHQGGLSLLQLCLYTEGGCVYVCVFSDCGMLIVHLPIYTCTCMLP